MNVASLTEGIWEPPTQESWQPPQEGQASPPARAGTTCHRAGRSVFRAHSGHLQGTNNSAGMGGLWGGGQRTTLVCDSSWHPDVIAREEWPETTAADVNGETYVKAVWVTADCMDPGP